ncbi:rab-like protein 3 isoform X1 [Branchiostoma floridae]|uniref:Rab-like protein 3 n=1 Tax=Branchiostoma floridae TaxID=7739 RepID=A0A9J7KMU1_BRAFL|nr:rab-like protein 3 isoform X1 [Branchiostoma floridae]
MAVPVEKVKVLVLGDSGVGKSSLVHLICQGEAMGNSAWTIGCNVDVKLHDYREEGTPHEKTFCVELWDVGGSINHSLSHSVFFNSAHGLVLVHDLTNRKSQENLRRWLGEVLSRDAGKKYSGEPDYDEEVFSENQLPALVIGTKMDRIPDSNLEEVLSRSSSVAGQCRADFINLDCMQNKHLAAGTTNAVKLSRFFDKVIERRYYTQDSRGRLGSQERRRPPSMTRTFSPTFVQEKID